MTEIKQQLIRRLNADLQKYDGPRQRGATPWNTYPFSGSWPLLNTPHWKQEGMPSPLPQ